MHTCPFCGYECDCDLDDCGGLPVPADCPHVCDEPDYHEDEYYFEDCDYDDYMAHRQQVVHLWRFWVSWDKGDFWRTVKIKYFPPSPNVPLPF